MKVPAAVFALALAGSVAAQGGPELPACAQDCANKFLTGGIGNCGSDPTCICSNKDFLGSIACCLVSVCDTTAQSSAIGFAATLCKGFGVSDLPTTVACATASGAAATTTAASASTTASSTTASSSATTAAAASSSESKSTGATQTSAGAQSTAAQSTSKSTNYGPRPTAAAGLGAIGGIIAAVALF